MTTNQMTTLLGYFLDDPNEGTYTAAIKLAALNAAQKYIAGIVGSGLLEDLQTDTTFSAEATGNSVPTNYFRYTNSVLYSLSPQKWVTKLEVDDLDMHDNNQYSRGSQLGPVCYLWGNSYYLMTDSADFGGTNANVRLYYLKTTTDMTAGDTCELSEILHDPFVGYTEAQLRMTYKFGDPQILVAKMQESIAKIRDIDEKHKQGDIL